jgi:GDP-L-fucose synthase
MPNEYRIFERPSLQYFLDYLFLNYDVSIFTAADKEYASFIYENIMIEAIVLHAVAELTMNVQHEIGRENAQVHKIPKLLFLGSSCIYPKLAPQPIKEEYLLTGSLEQTNEPYAIAKIAGIKMCESYRRQYGCNFIAVMPTNLYGPNDNYDLENSHVLPAILRKIHTAKVQGAPTVQLWGTGKAFREFMHVDDLAEACVFLMNTYNEEQPINIGVGTDLSIKELAEMIQSIVGFTGEILFDTSKPDGTPRKLLDVSKLTALGFKSKIGLREGIEMVYREILDKKIF